MASSASSARHPALSASWTMRSRHRSDTTSSSSDSDSSGQSQDLAGRPVTKTTDQVPDLTDYGAVPTFTPPTFTMKELFEVIPRHCFERSLLRSTRYLAQDIGMAAALMLAATYIDRAFGINGLILTETYGRVAQVVAWMLYWYFAGLVWTGTQLSVRLMQNQKLTRDYRGVRPRPRVWARRKHPLDPPRKDFD